MSNNDDTKIRTTIYLEPDLLLLIKKAAKEKDRSFTKQTERILKKWLIDNGYLLDNSENK